MSVVSEGQVVEPSPGAPQGETDTETLATGVHSRLLKTLRKGIFPFIIDEVFFWFSGKLSSVSRTEEMYE